MIKSIVPNSTKISLADFTIQECDICVFSTASGFAGGQGLKSDRDRKVIVYQPASVFQI